MFEELLVLKDVQFCHFGTIQRRQNARAVRVHQMSRYLEFLTIATCICSSARVALTLDLAELVG